MKTIFRSLIFILLMLAPYLIVQGQTPDEVTKIKAIAKYVGGNSSRIDQILQQIGYTAPQHLTTEFSKYPAVKKIRMAYQAAEEANKGKGGENLIREIYRSTSEKYQAIRSEKNLAGIDLSKPRSQLPFKQPPPSVEINLKPKIRGQVLSLSKYVDRGGLGGARGVLKHRFQLSDNEVFDILNSSKTNQEALQRGLTVAKEPPPKEVRLKGMANELSSKYQGARADPDIKKIVGADLNKNSVSKRQTKLIQEKSLRLTSRIQANNKTRTVQTSNARGNYRSYIKNANIPKIDQAFGKLIKSSKAWGGIIFGNNLVDKTNLPNIEKILFFPIEEISRDGLEMGNLEIEFIDGRIILVTSVLKEDVVAAHGLLFDDEFPFIEGEGLGILSIENVFHPAIASLSLSTVLMKCDEFNLPPNYKSYCDIPSNKGFYKFIDVPKNIFFRDGQLITERNDEVEPVTNANISLVSPHEALDREIIEFYNCLPQLVFESNEYFRFNEFTKLFSVLRWAKRKNGKIINVPDIEYISHEDFDNTYNNVNELLSNIYHYLDDIELFVSGTNDGRIPNIFFENRLNQDELNQNLKITKENILMFLERENLTNWNQCHELFKFPDYLKPSKDFLIYEDLNELYLSKDRLKEIKSIIENEKSEEYYDDEYYDTRINEYEILIKEKEKEIQETISQNNISSEILKMLESEDTSDILYYHQKINSRLSLINEKLSDLGFCE